MRKYKKLADVIRGFANTDLLACSIENITEEQARDIDDVEDLADFLEDELQYANE